METELAHILCRNCYCKIRNMFNRGQCCVSCADHQTCDQACESIYDATDCQYMIPVHK